MTKLGAAVGLLTWGVTAGFLPGCSEEGDEDSNTGGQGGAVGGQGGQGLGGSEPAVSYDEFITELPDDGGFEIEAADLKMRVTLNDGGRITSFKVEGKETLVQEGEAAQFGATFWPSPQNWPWPPSNSLSELEANDYVAELSDAGLSLQSEVNTWTGLSVRKDFTPLGDAGIDVTYVVLNESENIVSIAPWEITRVAQGMAFFPTGPGEESEKTSLEVEIQGGHTWYLYDAAELTGDPKLFADGAEGWLAFAVPGESGDAETLVMHLFEDIESDAFAPGEAEVEVYASATGEYFEVEQQGRYQELEPGEHLSWSVLWQGVDLDSVPMEVGNEELLEAARGAL